MAESKSLQLLKQLKKDHDSRSVSVLVGSGFSKNAISDYMDWNELLNDIVLFLYEQNIKESYGRPLTEPGYRMHKKNAVNRYLKEIGYLNLVSQYIDAKGYREAIEVYIEEHIPYIEVDKSNKMLSYKNSLSSQPFTQNNLLVHKELLTCQWKNVFTTNYDNLLELTNDSFNLDYQTIVSDYQLSSLNIKRGIIKVHGNLVKNSLDSDYEFDNDKSRRYIISKEDYETYAERHQAFSFFMRTSLLTGSFCLIGFSGNDPNFLGWLEWMRDILDKDINSNSKQKTKVYLISVESKDLEKDRELFYKNHRIGIINIKDPEVLKELTFYTRESSPKEDMIDGGNMNEPTLTENSSISELLIQLFKYLKRDNSEHMDGSNVSRYYELWSDLSNISNEHGINQLKMIRETIIPPKKTKAQYNFIYNQIGKNNWDDINTQLFAIAANDCGLFPSCFKDQKIGEINEIMEWQQMQLLEAAYHKGDFPESIFLDEDTINYFRILRHLFFFEFDEADTYLKKWEPLNDWKVIKASLLSTYDRDKSIELLEQFLHESDHLVMKYYATCLMNIFISVYPPRYSYKEYQKEHLDNVWDISNEIISSLKKKTEKLLPYGTVERSFSFSNEISSFTQSIKYLAFLSKTGFRLQFGSVILIQPIEWYSVFKLVFEFLPYPCLFFSLQLTDKNVLHRIGQDFAYSEHIAEEINIILPRLLNVLLNNSFGINTGSYYIICSELFAAVKEDLWFGQFFEILKKHFIPFTDRFFLNDDITIFVKTATSLLRNPQNVKNVFCRLIDCMTKTNIYMISEIIYNMKLSCIQSIPPEQAHIIARIISSQPVTLSYLLVSTLYKHALIDDGLKELVSNRIVENENNVKTADCNALYSLSRFLNNNENAENVIKRAILSKDIWNCGIHDDHSASLPQYIRMNLISNYMIWNNSELQIIMDNLTENLNKIKSSSFLHDFMLGSEYISLATDMQDFVENVVIEKYKNDSYITVLDEIKAFLNKLSTFGGSFDILYDTNNDIRDAVNYLARCIDYYGAKKYTEYINALICRALMKDKKYLNLVLSFIEFMVLKHYDFFETPEGKHKLELLLDVYMGIDYREIEVHIPSAYRALRNVAKSLLENGANSHAINYWLNDPKVSRFYSENTL